MRLRLMAPFRSHFCLNTGALPINDIDKNYINFWTEIAENYDAENTDIKNRYKNIVFMHREKYLKRIGKTLYEKIDEDTLKYSLHLLELTPKRTNENIDINKIFEKAVEKEKKRVEICDKIFDLCKPDPNSVSVRLYDNTISIAQMDLILSNLSNYIDSSNHEPFLDILRSIGITFAHTYTVELYDTVIFPFLSELSDKFDLQSRYIKSIKKCDETYDDFYDMLPYVVERRAHRPYDNCHSRETKVNTTVLWITRSLIFDKGDQEELVNNFAEYWLKDIGNKEKRVEEINAVKSDPKKFSLSWLNYVFGKEAFALNDKQNEDQEKEIVPEFNDAWESMLMSQYFYSALECLNNNLQRVIGRSYSPDAYKELRKLNRQLKRTTATTNLLIINYHDIQKYLKRDKKEIMSQIMETWDFESLIENAQKRIDLCGERINSLHKVSTERSSLTTDLILIGIGTVSFISLIITLSQYGRLLNTDATLGFRNDGPFNIFGFISGWPMDYVLFGGILIILVLTYFYYRYRQKKLL